MQRRDRVGGLARTRVEAVDRVPGVEDEDEEGVLEIVADDVVLNALAPGAGTETFARKYGFSCAIGVGVSEGGGGLSCGVNSGGAHVDGVLGIGR